MKKIILFILLIFLTGCERQVKDYAKYISPKQMQQQQFVYAPLGQIQPGAVFSADSSLLGIAPFLGLQNDSLRLQTTFFAHAKPVLSISPGYFRLNDIAAQKKLEVAAAPTSCFFRVSGKAQLKQFTLSKSVFMLSPNKQITGTSNQLAVAILFHSFVDVAEDSANITFSSQDDEFLFQFVTDTDAQPNWYFEHYYLNTLQAWNNALNELQFRGKNAEVRGVFFTDLYQALQTPQENVPSSYADFLLHQLQNADTDSVAAKVFAHLGLVWQQNQFSFAAPDCKEALIKFNQPVAITNKAGDAAPHAVWNNQPVKTLKPAELQQGGSLTFIK